MVEVDKSKLSPMMRQYLDIKEEHRDEILFFRLGDFYEMFFDDAITASRELELTLTGKQCGLEERAPMCGVPFHAADTYIARLIGKGYKVAICEQVEDPASAKGIVRREVIQIVTPGTAMTGSMLNEKENNYIASVYTGRPSAGRAGQTGSIGLSYCDVSTGEICLTSFSGPSARQTLINELVKISASELILDEYTSEALDIEELRTSIDSYIDLIDGRFYRQDALRDTIRRQFSVTSSRGIGVEEDTEAETALGALLLYLYDTQKSDLSHINTLTVYSVGDHMSLDKATIKNLELTETLFEKKLQGSLLGVLDKTHTAMGSRMMKHWIRQPLNNAPMINSRLDAVEVLLEDVLTRNNIKENLKKVYDFERLTGRIATGRANGPDLVALADSCRVLPELRMDLSALDSELIRQLHDSIYPLEEICSMVDAGIVEEPPFTIKEGGLIRAGYSQELDDLKASIADAQQWIASLETTEKERTGIKNLKVGYNKVFGYYIEVTKSNYELVPDDYIRKQTLVNCERFITPQLKETERLVLNAEAEINKLEYELFCEMRGKLREYIGQIQSTSHAVAALDVLTAFAQTAEKNDYVKPVIDDGDVISIEQGRHPVIEQSIRDGIFVSNDTYLDRKDTGLLIITGPNMSGKSTYMRQTALIVLMAQAGCFVPASRARVGICDRIFTRIGASDNLAQGQSTFYVEMSELAYILNSATTRSLIILDEIGRGTSTYDGLSIAWATAEFISKRHIRTLFATHYHEMTVLENTMDGIRNLNVDVLEDNGNIVFLHKIVEGSASRSYGIHVAQLAGVPEELLENARGHLDSLGGDMAENAAVVEENTGETQLTFFETMPDPVKEKLKSLDLMNTTPSQALQILEDLQKNL